MLPTEKVTSAGLPDDMRPPISTPLSGYTRLTKSPVQRHPSEEHIIQLSAFINLCLMVRRELRTAGHPFVLAATLRRMAKVNSIAQLNLASFFFLPFVRLADLRLVSSTFLSSSGYFEDRRPASNMDPYVVTSMIAETTILWKTN